MKKKIASLALVLALCLSLLPVTAFAEEDEAIRQPTYSGGAGTQNDPWLISTVSDLQTLATTVNNGIAAGFDADCVDSGNGIPGNYHGYYFKQTADLDLSSIENWEPIGYSGSCYFAGNYDADNHIISNAKSTGKNDDEGYATAGVFGWVAFGSVCNLHIRSVNFSATGTNKMAYAGGLMAVAYQCNVENCSVFDSAIESSREPNNSNFAGGIVGIIASPSSFKKCASERNSIKTMAYGGGFMGSTDYEVTTNATDCYVANCSVVGSSTDPRIATEIGAFLGASQECDSNLTNCFIYDCTVQKGTDSLAGSSNGLFTGNTYYGKINAKNLYYYDQNGIDVNAETAQSRSADEFAKADMAASLGNAFVQGTNYPVIRISATGIVLDKENISLSVGATQALVATVMPSVATNKNVIWTSNHPEIATVENGVVTAVAAGKAIITATTEDGNNVATCTVTVATPVTAVTLDKTTLSIKRGNTEILTATVEPEDASNKNVTWASDNEAVATVDENGLVTAVSAGTANITVTTVDGEKTATCVVTVRNPSSSGSSRPRYDVTTPSKPENGSVTVDPERARSGSRVTVTVTPDSGYKLGELVVTDKDGKKLELTDKGNGQYTFTMPSGKVEVAAEFVKEVEVSPFADVATDAYYYDAVKWAVEKGVTNGVSETLFGPDQACTRAQIVTFLWRAAGSPEPKSGSSFADVAADAYYAKAVAWAVENGITKGTSETTFHPDETCTRAQGVTFLYRALGKLAAAQAGFTDVAADSYYADAVNWAAENGVTKGISETLFGPDGSCTRAQIVTFLYRAYQGK